jgi:hypothetical protein
VPALSEPIGVTVPEESWVDVTGPSGGAVRPATLRELRGSLAACQLIVATVVHNEELGHEPTRLLRMVVEELASDIDYLWDGEPEGGSGANCAVGSAPDLGEAARRVLSCGNLLNGAATWFTLDPDLADRLDAAIGQLDETVELIWATGTAAVDLLDG